MSFYSTVARYYDAENADKTDDIAFYLELADETAGTIFDVGCGSGRVVLPLAREGYVIHGVDDNRAMLEYAERQMNAQPDVYKTATLHEGDVLTYDAYGTNFDLVLLTYNMLMHFHEQDAQLALLKRMREIIAPDGLMVIDLPNAGEMFATEDTDEITLERTFLEPENGHMVMQQSVSELDRTTQMMRVLWIYDEILGGGTVKRTTAPKLFRYFFPYEMQLLLKLTGFRVQEMLGDVDGSPFEDGCPRMIVLAVPENEPLE